MKRFLQIVWWLGVMVCVEGWGQAFPNWTGTGNWNNGSNWSTGSFGYGQIQFQGGGSVISNNDFNPASQWRIFFNNTVAYTLTGNAVHLFDFSGNPSWVLSQSTALQTINPLISFRDNSGGSRQAWITTRNTGGFQFGNVELAGNVTLLRMSGQNTNGRITIGGVLSSGLNIPVVIGRDETNAVQPNTRVTFDGVNTYTGNTDIDAGELWIGTGNINNGTISVGNASAANQTAKLWLSVAGGGTTFSRPIIINQGDPTTREIGGLNTSGTHTFSGNITNNSTTGGLLLSTINTGGSVNYSGILSGGGAYNINGPGTSIFSGTSANTFTGLTSINAGTLVLNKTAGVIAIPTNTTIATGATIRTDAANQWGTGTPPLVTLNGNAILNLNNFNQRIALASASSTSSVTLGSATLEINNTGNDTYAGVISGTGGLIKADIGTQTLSGVNTYAGSTTISANGGILRISADNNLGAAPATPTPGHITLTGSSTGADPATLEVNGTFTLNSNRGIAITGVAGNGPRISVTTGNALTYNGIITGNRNLVKSGAGTLVLGGASTTFSGGVSIINGAVEIRDNSALGTGTLTFGGTGATAFTLIPASGDRLIINNVTLGSNVLIGSPAIIAGSNNLTVSGTLTNDGASRALSSTSTGITTFSGSVFLSENNSNSRLLTFLGTGSIVVSGNILNNNGFNTLASSLTYDGSGSLTLSNANTYSGTTTLNSGTLNINNATAIGTGTFTITGGTINNTSGSPITLTNNNVQNWNADFTFTGTNNLNLGSGAVTLSANRQVTVSANTLTVGGVISGGFGLTKAGAGTLVLSGASTYTGATTINAGVLEINGGGNRLPTGTALTLGNLAGVTFNLNGQNQQIGSLAGGGTTGGNITLGTGVLTLSSGNTSFGGSISGLAGAGFTNAGSTLAFSGNLSGPSVTLTNSSGALTLSGSNTFTGNTTISGGSITYNTVSSMPSGSNIILQGGTLAISNGIAASSALSAGTLTVSGTNSTINLGSGSNVFSLTFGDSKAATWTGTLTINNWTTTAGKEIYFLAQGLTPAQLDAINFTGYGQGAKFDGATNRIIPKFLYTTIAGGSGPFSLNSSWLNNDKPSGDCSSNPPTIIIQNTFTLTLDEPVQLTRIENNGTLLNSGVAISLCNGGNVVNNGIINFVAGSGGTFTCLGGATFSGGATSDNYAFNNLTLAGTTTFSTNPTVRGTLQLNTGATLGTEPIYSGTGSSLVYNQSGSVTMGNEWLTGNGTSLGVGLPQNVTIQNNTTVNFSANQRGVAGDFTIASGSNAVLNVSSGTLFIRGNFTNNGTFTHTAQALHFTGTTNQTISGIFSGTGTDATNCIPRLIIDKSGGNLLLGNSVNIAGITNPVVTLTNGNIVLGAHNLTLTSGSTFSGTFGSTRMVVADGTGQVRYSVPAASNITFNFPVGDATVTPEYSPISITLNNTGAGGSFGVNVTNAAHPNINNPTTIKSINRYWSVTTNSLNNYTWSGNFTYLDADLQPLGATNEANLRANVWYPAPVNGWELLGGSINTSTKTVSITGGTFGSLANGAITARIFQPLYYRTAGAGPADWASPGSWIVSTDINFVSPVGSAATFAPSHINSAGITIQNGHTIQVTNTHPVDDLVLNGTLNINSGAIFGLINGTAATDFTIGGTGRINLNGGLFGSVVGSSTTIATGGYWYNALQSPSTDFQGSYQFASNSTYQHDVNGGTIPGATWQSGSNVLITGITTSNSIGGLGQSFSNLAWNCSQTQAISIAGTSGLSIQGNFNIQNTGSSELRLFSETVSGSNSLTIGGDLVISGGRLAMIGGGTYTAGRTLTLSVGRDVLLSNAGVLEVTNGLAALGSGHSSFINIARNLTISNTASIQRAQSNVAASVVFNASTGSQAFSSHNTGINQHSITFQVGTGSSTNSVTLNSSMQMNAGSTLVVMNGANLVCNNQNVTGGTFTLNGGGILTVGSAQGITTSGSTGNIQTTTRNFPQNANYVYNGSGNQVTGNGLPATITGSLQVSNTGGVGNNAVTLTNQPTTTASLVLTAGRFQVGSGQNFNISASGTITATGGDFATGVDAGTVQFLGDGTVSATGNLNFWNVNLPTGSGGVNFGTAGTPTIVNELMINSGRFIQTNAPFYANTSTLVYNTGNTFIAGSEWYAVFTSGRGIPHHVQIGRTGVNNSILTFGTNTLSRYATGNIIIGDGLGTGYNFSLSTSSGGDVGLGGNWILNNNASFTPNNREVSFAGNALQSITGTQSTSFDFLRINNPAGVNMQLNTTAFFLTLQNGLFTPGSGRTLFIKPGGTISNSGHSGSLPGDATGGLINFIGAGTVTASQTNGLLFWDVWLEPTATPQFFSFGSDAGSPTLLNTLTLNAQRFLTNAPFYGTGSTLIYNSGGTFDRNVEWGALSGRGYPHHVRIQNNTTVNFHNTNPLAFIIGIAGDLILGHESGFGSLNFQDRAHRLIVNRDVILGANTSGGTSNLILGNFSGGDLEIGRNFTRTANGDINFGSGLGRAVFFTGAVPATISAPATQNFPFLIIDKGGSTANTLTLNQSVNVTQRLILTSGRVITSSSNLLRITNSAPDDASNGIVYSDGNPAYIDGPLRRDVNNVTGSNSYVFPVGRLDGSTHFAKRIRMKELTNGAGSFTVTYERGNPPGGIPYTFQDIIKGIRESEYWNVDQSSGSTEGRIVLPYTYLPGNTWLFSDGNPVTPNLIARVAVVRGSGANWNVTDPLNSAFSTEGSEPEGRLVNTDGDISSRHIVDFSPFTFGWGLNQVLILPLKLLGFTARATGPDVLLQWQYADAKDLAYTTIEYSTDGQRFGPLQRVAGTTALHYNHRHLQPGSGIHYYRLLMADKNGETTYSAVQVVQIGVNQSYITGLLQNPVQGAQALVQGYSATAQTVRVLLSDIQGRRLLAASYQVAQGSFSLPVSLLPVAKGNYYLQLFLNDGTSKTMKVVY